MPDKRKHRSSHPKDDELFADAYLPVLNQALDDMCWLLSRGYAEKGTLKLVGDRYSLVQRQRIAIMRSACSNQRLKARKQKQIDPNKTNIDSIAIDGFNLLITIEAAVSGGYIFKGRDGILRDLASVHSTYRKVTETIPALKLIGKVIQSLGIEKCLWLLDSPVSNSGRLKSIITKLAKQHRWDWQVELSLNPDTQLKKTQMSVVSSDSVVMDNCGQWLDLASLIIFKYIPDAKIIDLSFAQ